jgi:CRISPR/Cas system-associated endonuclease/helicase Cas3
MHIPLKVLSKNQLEFKIMEACKSHPDTVSECFSKRAKEIMYVLKLVDYDIVSMKSGAFYDGSIFIGNTPDSILDYIRKEENKEIILKWAEAYRKKEGVVIEGIDDKDIATDKDKMYAEAKNEFETNLKYARASLEGKLLKMDEKKLNSYAEKHGISGDVVAILDRDKLIDLLIR